MTRKVFILVIPCLIALAVFVSASPLRRPESSIQSWVEKETPLGSSLAEVQAEATRRGWYDPRTQGSDGRTSGTYLRGLLGEYRGLLFVTSVTVFWEFDSNNRLANIRIWKTQMACEMCALPCAAVSTASEFQVRRRAAKPV